MPPSIVKAIVFDLGEVLIKLDFSQVMALRKKCTQQLEASIQSMNEWPIYDAFERGHVNEFEFIQKINLELSLSLNPETFKTIWNSVLKEPVPEIGTTLKRLNKKYPLWALTNSNETHIKHFKNNYPWHQEFQEVLTSFELGHRKPEKEIYEKMLNRIGFKSDEILFLDDRKENVEGARKLGIRSELCQHTPEDLPHIFKRHSINF
ncbi:HAD family phosphatase [bacterium]|nr:HAD family phosphatase [bacterium]